MPLLGYTSWRRFEYAINESIEALKIAGGNDSDHFEIIFSAVKRRQGGGSSQQNYKISAIGCIFVVFSCDQRKPEVRNAQAYFLPRICKLRGYADWSQSVNETDKNGFVYLVKAENTSYFKIGKSKHPYKRLTQLQTGSPIPLTIVERVFSLNCCNLENLLHNHYEAYQVRGEWFDLPDECVRDFFWVATKFDRQAEDLLLPTDNTGTTHE